MLIFLVRAMFVVGYLSCNGSLSATLLAPEMKNFTASLGTLEGALQKFINPSTHVVLVPKIEHTNVKTVPILSFEEQLKEAIAKAQQDLITFDKAVQTKATTPNDKIKYGRLLLSYWEIKYTLTQEIKSKSKNRDSTPAEQNFLEESDKFLEALNKLQNKFEWLDHLERDIDHANDIIHQMIVLGNKLSKGNSEEKEENDKEIQNIENELKDFAVLSDKVKNPVNERFSELETTKTYDSKSDEAERKHLKRQKEGFASIEKAVLTNYNSFIEGKKNKKAIEAQKSLRKLKFYLDTIINDNIKAEMIEEEAKAQESKGEEDESGESKDTSILALLWKTIESYLRGAFVPDGSVILEGKLAYDALKFEEILERITAHVPSLYLSKAEELAADILKNYKDIHELVNKKFLLQSRLKDLPASGANDTEEEVQDIEGKLTALSNQLTRVTQIWGEAVIELTFWAKNPHADTLIYRIKKDIKELMKKRVVHDDTVKLLQTRIAREFKRLVYMAKEVINQAYSQQLANGISAASIELEKARKADNNEAISAAYKKFKTLLNNAVAKINKQQAETGTAAQ